MHRADQSHHSASPKRNELCNRNHSPAPSAPVTHLLHWSQPCLENSWGMHCLHQGHCQLPAACTALPWVTRPTNCWRNPSHHLGPWTVVFFFFPSKLNEKMLCFPFLLSFILLRPTAHAAQSRQQLFFLLSLPCHLGIWIFADKV